MYLSQIINVNLTQENADILKQPSKVFNKIKAAFSGDMTPTEQRQSIVMLSVLQRLNIAHRKAGFDDLLSIAANDKLLFESDKVNSNNLEQANVALTYSFNSGDLTQINTLALTIDGQRSNLRFLIHVNIVRKPKNAATPVTINIYGFINEFKKLPTESELELSKRVKSLIQNKWGNKQQQTQRLSVLEQEFDHEVVKLQREIDLLFPAQSDIASKQKVLGTTTLKSKHRCHSVRYDATCAYLPIFYLEASQAEDFDQDEYVKDKLDVWDEDSSFNDNDSQNNWSGGDSSSSDSSANCGSSCGGGCSS